MEREVRGGWPRKVDEEKRDELRGIVVKETRKGKEREKERREKWAFSR